MNSNILFSVSQLHLNLDQIIRVNGSIKSSVDTSQSVLIQNTENIQHTATEVTNEAITTPSETSENYQSTATAVTNEVITTPTETSQNYQSTATAVTNKAITTSAQTAIDNEKEKNTDNNGVNGSKTRRKRGIEQVFHTICFR